MTGKKICQNCRFACQTDGEQVETMSDDNNDEFIDDSYLRDTLNISIGTLGCSLLKHVSKRSRVSYGKRKLDQVYTVVKYRFSSVLNIEDDSQKGNVVCCKKAKDLDWLMFLIKEKVTSSKTEEKAKLLTLVPHSWTLKEFEEFFRVSNRIARNSRVLKNEKELLPKVESRREKVLLEAIRDRVINFHQRH